MDYSVKAVRLEKVTNTNCREIEYGSEYRGKHLDDFAIKLHRRLRQQTRFILILDDVWEGIDLDALGVHILKFILVVRLY